MRPDKKKNRHHDSLKCEAKAKQKAAEKAKKEQKQARPKQPAQPEAATVPEVTHQGGDRLYSKRNISSNWTKYEIPSSDEEDAAEAHLATGPDFNFVLESASNASSQFQFKSEMDWGDVDTVSNLEQSQFFALDLSEFADCINCIPLHKQLGLDEDDFSEETIKRFESKDEANKTARRQRLAKDGEGVPESIDKVNAMIIDKLTIKKESKTVELKEEEADIDDLLNTPDLSQPVKAEDKPSIKTKDTKEENLEEWLDDLLDD